MTRRLVLALVLLAAMQGAPCRADDGRRAAGTSARPLSIDGDAVSSGQSAPATQCLDPGGNLVYASEPRNDQPAWSPDGKKIAFASNRTGGGIYVINLDGCGLRRVTKRPEDRDPAWSPDGRKIAFVRVDAGTSAEFISVVARDGTAVKRLTRPRKRLLGDVGPEWSPDGRKLVFTRFLDETTGAPADIVEGYSSHIYVMNADGSGVRRLTQRAGADVLHGEPAWSPDGRKIAWRHSNGSIDVMNADGTAKRAVTRPPGGMEDESPAWLNRGRSIAFARGARIYKVRTDGKGLRILIVTEANDTGFVWSPDRSRIAFAREGFNSKTDVYVMRADGARVRRLTRTPTDELAPSFGPDGSIVFASDRSGDLDLYVVAGAGAPARRITSGADWDSSPAWSRDGKTIAFTRSGGLMVAVYLIRRDGSELRKVADGSQPAWSPDGGRLAFGARSGIVVANADGSDARRLTEEGDDPTWSPDGKTIAVERFDPQSDSYRIDAVSPSDGSIKPLFRPAGYSAAVSPDWSHDGTRIAFQYFSLSEPPGIYLISPDGTGSPQPVVTAAGGGFEFSDPAWSPDGTQLAFARAARRESARGGAYGGAWIYVVKEDGSGLTRVSQ